ncbi:MAG: hypothetical protein NTW21_27130 [Verrucomicrobia bacterium]|nr:hypothetical protein [Verrucomicrobiota bacterium]
MAQRIHAGRQHVTDLKPHERDNYAKAVELLGGLQIPLVAAVEDYVQARKLAESESLTTMTWGRWSNGWNASPTPPAKPTRPTAADGA